MSMRRFDVVMPYSRCSPDKGFFILDTKLLQEPRKLALGFQGGEADLSDKRRRRDIGG